MEDQHVKEERPSIPALPAEISKKIKAGVALFRAGKLADANRIFQKIIKASPSVALAHYNLGLVYLTQKKIPEAAAAFAQCLKYAPKSAMAHAKLAECYIRTGKLQQAVKHIETSLTINPDQHGLLGELGRLQVHFKDWEKARYCFSKAAQMQPGNASILNNLGNVCNALDQRGDAQKAYHQAIKADPDNAQAYYNLANLHLRAGNETAARTGMIKALERKPDQFHMLSRMGNLFAMWRYHGAALTCFTAAHEKKPDDMETLRGLGRAYADGGKPDEAIECFERVSKAAPEDWQPLYDIADVCVKCRRIPKAVEYFRKVMKRKPDHYMTAARLFFHQREICDWEGLDELSNLLDQAIAGRKNEKNPIMEPAFINISRSEDPAQNYKNSRDLAMGPTEQAKRRNLKFDYAPALALKDKIHVGYLSFDFRDHPTSHLIAGLFEQHDRDKFHITAFSYGGDDGGVHRKRIEQGVDTFVNMRGLGDLEAAQKIHKQGSQILVDLMGHTTGTRLVIPALRPAPVQMYYLGYPGTIGGDFFDYTLVDNVIAPKAEAKYFGEKLAVMPDSYQINDHLQKFSEDVISRKDFGLPEDKFVFCCFSLAHKIEPTMFESWMNILKRTPDSVLWIYVVEEEGRRNLRSVMQARGLDSDRLIFADREPKARHLSRLKLADLGLDTRIYNGHTTTSDTLWAGTPVITLKGKHFASRVSASLLGAIKLPELVTDKFEDMENLAVKLATDKKAKAKLDKKLEKNRLTTPLFDTPLFARNLENLYSQMWPRYLDGKKPIHLKIK